MLQKRGDADWKHNSFDFKHLLGFNLTYIDKKYQSLFARGKKVFIFLLSRKINIFSKTKKKRAK